MALPKIVGGGLIFLGLLSFIVQILVLTYTKVELNLAGLTIKETNYNKYEACGVGIWAGGVFIAAGAAGMLFAERKSAFLKKVALIVCALSIGCCVAQIAIASASIDTINSINTETCDAAFKNYCTDHLVFNSLLVTAGIVALILSAIYIKLGQKSK